MKKMTNEKKVELFFLGSLICSIIGLIMIHVFWGQHWINSDMSAEMIFAQLLNQEGNWIASTNWYYSTEFRILYSQLIMVPLFSIFESWEMIRIITNICFYLGMLASYFYVCKQLNLKKVYVYGTALGLFIPISEAVMTHVQMGNTYMAHIILIFLGYGLFLHIAKEQTGTLKSFLRIAIFILLSIILGMSGVRYLLDLYVPIVLTAVLEIIKSKSFQEMRRTAKFTQNMDLIHLKVAMIGTVGAILGYFYNALFISKYYDFQTYDSINFIQIHQGVFWERVQNAFGELLQVLGYIENKSVISLHGVITLLSFLFLILFVFICLKTKTKECFTIEFVKVSFLVHIFVFIFTTSTMVDRYYIPILIFMLPVIALYLQNVPYKFDRRVVTVLLLASLLVVGAKTVYSLANNDKNADRYEVVAVLEEQQYEFGYASYWNANIMTELSNGNIEIANLNSIDSLSFFLWSSKKTSYEEKTGKVFLLIEKEELEAVAKYQIDQNQEVIYENETYIIYHFDNQEQFLEYGKEK